jgi:hypothetical protein
MASIITVKGYEVRGTNVVIRPGRLVVLPNVTGQSLKTDKPPKKK